jgi:uncharacterized protein (TIGR04141 family)
MAGEKPGEPDPDLPIQDSTGPAPSLASWKLIRLKSPITGIAVTAAAQFIRDIGKSPFIQDVAVPGATLSLYGYHDPGEPPSFAAFLKDFTQLVLPSIPAYAYVIIIRMDDEAMPWYAMPFGLRGIYLLLEDALDFEASREIGVEMTTPADATTPIHIRQLGTTQLGPRPMRVQKRATGDASLGDFNFDRYSEIFNDVDAKPQDRQRYGSSVRAGKGLGLSKRITLSEIPANVTLFEDAKKAAEAKTMMTDVMRTVKDPQLMRDLDEALVAAVRDDKSDAITFSIPDFIYADEWPTMKLTLLGRIDPLPDDLDINGYRTLLKNKNRLGSIDLEYLKRAEVVVGEERQKRFRIYNCLTAEILLNGQTFVHYDRGWYAIPSDVLGFIDQAVDDILPWNAGLVPPTTRVTEPYYNQKLVNNDLFLYLDTATEPAFPGEYGIEMCDLLTIENDMVSFIHLKTGFASSKLSHLFNQGRASALMMLESGPRHRFRERLMAELKKAKTKPRWSRQMKGYLSDNGFSSRRTRIVYAILGSWNGELTSKRLPFMSKLNLSMAARDLRGRLFDVRIAQLQMP